MVIFTIGNLACALAPTYEVLMIARVITSLAHGTFFGVGAVVATGLGARGSQGVGDLDDVLGIDGGDVAGRASRRMARYTLRLAFDVLGSHGHRCDRDGWSSRHGCRKTQAMLASPPRSARN